MILLSETAWTENLGIPRESGDDPLDVEFPDFCLGYSPRERG